MSTLNYLKNVKKLKVVFHFPINFKIVIKSIFFNLFFINKINVVSILMKQKSTREQEKDNNKTFLLLI